MNVEPYRKQLFVCTGFKKGSEIVKIQERISDRDSWKMWCRKQEEIWDGLLDGSNSGFCSFNAENGSGIIALQEYNDSWEYWEVLIHELTHYVQDLLVKIHADDEGEARAYLHEHLFHVIRRILQGVDPIPRI